MKLWWPHNEAMVAVLLAYSLTGDARWWAWFERITSWTMTHFPDTRANALAVPSVPAVGGLRTPPSSMGEPGGEWFGYLTREGHVSQRFKGGPYKGCFHVPRSLFLCGQIITSILATAPIA